MMKPITDWQRRPKIYGCADLARVKYTGEVAYHRIFGSEVVNDECTDDCAGDVEQALSRVV